MNTFKADNATANLIHHTFTDKTHLPDNNHLVHRYFVSQFADRKIILNDPQTHGVPVVGSNLKITIVSLL